MKQLQVKKHMMTAISYLIPFVCAAGMLMVIGNIAGGTSVTDFSKQLAIPDLLTTLGIRIPASCDFNRNRIFYCGQSRYCTWCYHGNSL